MTIHATQSKDENGLVTIMMDNVAGVGLAVTTEIRRLNWDTREHKDCIWGNIRRRSRYIPTANIEEGEKFLQSGWLEETVSGDCIQDKTESSTGSWTSVTVFHAISLLDKLYHD